MKKNTEYLLKYISNEIYDKILKNTNAYILDNLIIQNAVNNAYFCLFLITFHLLFVFVKSN